MNHLQSTASDCDALRSFVTITDSTNPSGPLISKSQAASGEHKPAMCHYYCLKLALIGRRGQLK